MTTIRRICAWCLKELGTVDGEGQTGVSHGICQSCCEEFLSERCLCGEAAGKQPGICDKCYEAEMMERPV